MKIRVLPVAIIVMLATAGLKSSELSAQDFANATPAQLEKLFTASGAPEKKEEKDSSGGHGEEKKEGEAKEGEKPDAIVVYQDKPKEPDALKFTDAEKEVLTKLSARRTELDNFAQELDLKANMVEASSKQLDDKLAKLAQLKADTEKLLATYQKQEDTKIKSLVKIYESMKPKQAAAVFDKMDMPIMLDIIDAMAEKKAALVLAQMNPEKAKQVTEELANQRTLAQAAGVKEGAADQIAN